MADPFLKGLCRQKAPLLGMICEFNLHPARYVHASRLPGGLSPALAGKLAAKKRSERNLSRYILRECGLEEAYWFDFAEARRRLALLDGPTLERLAYFTGIGFHAPFISRVIERRALLALKREIGDAAYGFALRKAPLLLGAAIRQRGGETGGLAGLGSRAAATGLVCLAECFAGEPPALVARLRLKLPRETGLSAAPDPAARESAWQVLQKVLLREVGPQWAPLFA